jgi:peptide deformylase
MGWLSGHEAQLRIMIETYKHQDGEGLGANKVGEGSGENIPEPHQKPTTKMLLSLNRTILGTD